MALRPIPLVAVTATPDANQLKKATPVYISGIAGAVPAATTTVNGTVKKAATVANATDAATAITQLNALLTSLRAAGTIV